jgi:hypothetical protein
MTPALRSQYESVIGYWADGIYEMTNGGHRLGKIRIFSEEDSITPLILYGSMP